MRSKFPMVLAGLALSVSSVAGAAENQPRIDTAKVERAAAPVADGNDLRGTTAWILAAIALGLIIWGALELLDDGTNAVPLSP